MKERHMDLVSGLAALVWAVLAVDADGGPLVPQFAALCSPMIAGPFALGALGRWYRSKRKKDASETQA